MNPQDLTKMTPQQLAKAMGGDFNNGWLNIPGPGHSKGDRSLGIRLEPHAPDGFWLYSFADDNLADCRAYVKALLRQIAKNGPICVNPHDSAKPQAKAKSNATALCLWEEAQPIKGSPASAYLQSRKCVPRKGEKWSSELRFHPACPFGLNRFPALVAAMRNVTSGEFTGIHRTRSERRRVQQARDAWRVVAQNDDGPGRRRCHSVA